jgi:hypothetical protein
VNKSHCAKHPFFIRVRHIEEKLFPKDLDPTDVTRIKSDKYSWLYRPSHHIESGLITEKDIEDLKSGKILLSVGAHPAYLERVLLELGVPALSITLADKDPGLSDMAGEMKHAVFDMTKPWPSIGSFDLIIFPESLCIALSNKVEQENPQKEGLHPNDDRESELLSFVIKQAFDHLKDGGEIRANGPQSHPNVVKMASVRLDQEGLFHTLEYDRYFLRVRRSNNGSVLRFR